MGFNFKSLFETFLRLLYASYFIFDRHSLNDCKLDGFNDSPVVKLAFVHLSASFRFFALGEREG